MIMVQKISKSSAKILYIFPIIFHYNCFSLIFSNSFANIKPSFQFQLSPLSLKNFI